MSHYQKKKTPATRMFHSTKSEESVFVSVWKDGVSIWMHPEKTPSAKSAVLPFWRTLPAQKQGVRVQLPNSDASGRASYGVWTNVTWRSWTVSRLAARRLSEEKPHSFGRRALGKTTILLRFFTSARGKRCTGDEEGGGK